MISTKGRYGLRVMLDIALQPQESNVALKDIAKRQNISKKYLEIIAKTLVQAKLLLATRGKGGGYRLSRSPESYTVGEILEVLEGTLCSVTCNMPEAAKCPREAACLTKPLWLACDEVVKNFLFSKRLSDLFPKSGCAGRNRANNKEDIFWHELTDQSEISDYQKIPSLG